MKRSSGILLHITSLPSKFGIGDLGPNAFKFVDFLKASKQSYWQILPIHPTDSIFGDSPYSSISAFAGNPFLISPEVLSEDGFLKEDYAKSLPRFSDGQVEYESVKGYKMHLLNLAYENFKKQKTSRDEFLKFSKNNKYWLDDYVTFVMLKEHHRGQMWNSWPPEFVKSDKKAIKEFNQKHKERTQKEKFFQFLFFKQWDKLHDYCRSNDIQIIGDVPFYVNFDSADVWANSENFKLDKSNDPTHVAGAPPDYFSAKGQRWGNPVYQWANIKKNNYEWWVSRIKHNIELFDYLRIDHFRGFNAYWEIPAKELTGRNGKWVDGPGDEFFSFLQKKFKELPIIAEDLGHITPDVHETMNRFGIPGMRVLMFAFGGDTETHPYIPENFVEDCVVYTGTHDNNTVKGWFEYDANPGEKKNLKDYVGKKIEVNDVHNVLTDMALMSKAKVAILPMQDVLGLGREARMNRPASKDGNWRWRVLKTDLTDQVKIHLFNLIKKSHRA